MMRIALFLLTNLAVMVVFGLVLSLTGIQSSSVQGLMIMALLFGFGGSFVSLLMSKWMALRSVGGEVIEQPRNERERWLVNTVATQARQAGIAMPQVAIYHAPDINAFATGARRDAPFSVVPENINAPSFPACFAIWVWVSGSVVLRPSMAERAQLIQMLMS